MQQHYITLSNAYRSLLTSQMMDRRSRFWGDHDFKELYNMLQRTPIPLRKITTNVNKRGNCFLNVAYQLLRNKMWIEEPFIHLVLGLLQAPVPTNHTDPSGLALKALFEFGLTTSRIYDATFPSTDTDRWADSIKNAVKAVKATKNEHAQKLYSNIWIRNSEDSYMPDSGSTPLQVFYHVTFLVNEMKQIVPENAFKGFHVHHIYGKHIKYKKDIIRTLAFLRRNFIDNQCLKQIVNIHHVRWQKLVEYEEQLTNINDGFVVTTIDIYFKIILKHRRVYNHVVSGVQNDGQWYLIDDSKKSGPCGNTLGQFIGGWQMCLALRRNWQEEFLEFEDIVNLQIFNIAYDKIRG